ncbi:phospholipid-transporting ATPase [Chloropicon primus]|nr:phospholipid-transporting ATPase [Chloropicon primus]
MAVAAARNAPSSQRGEREDKFRVVEFGPASGENTSRTPVWTPRMGDGGVAHIGRHRFCTNRISTAKYNYFTFLPKFLYIMFSRAAYFYFLVQMCLSWWTEVSPFGGIGFTMALVFVLLVAGVKEVVEDVKRHQFDRVTNQSTAHIVHLDADRDGVEIRDEKWEDVRVGQIILVQDGEEIPADCVCLHAAVENTCYVNTANLDGETNLKIRRAMRGAELCRGERHDEIARTDSVSSGQQPRVSSEERAKTMRDMDGMKEQAQKLAHIQGQVHCEPPSANLHTFKGFVSIENNPWVDEVGAPYSSDGGAAKYPLDMGEVMLRGTRLMNSGYAFGLVVYTGKETRIFMNNLKMPIKHSSMDNFLNIQIVILAIIQIVICVGCAVGSYVWREEYGFARQYMMYNRFVQNNYPNDGVYIIVYTITFWILFSSMLPISLIVSLEIVRMWQCIGFINFDTSMRVDNEDTSLWPKARNSNVNDDLARISYVFSDKTGTLTSNEMQLRLMSAGMRLLGDEAHKFEDMLPDDEAAHVASRFDPQLEESYRKIASIEQIVDALQLGAPAQASAGMTSEDAQVLKFFTSMALCHSVLPEMKGGDLSGYQGPSPDEVCIVNTMKQLGWIFKGNKSNVMYLDILGKKCKFRLLNVLDFSSDRKRMSVIIQDQRKKIYLICKGADAVMIPRTTYGPATNASSVEEVDKIVHGYSCKGLRCLMYGAKQLSQEEWEVWDQGFRQAANDIENREERMAECMEEIEKGLHFMGITAVEDKLQEEVPESIQILRDANIKVWVITGDKQETAINIGISCKLVSNQEELMIFNEGCKEKLGDSINAHLAELSRKEKSSRKEKELVIDGKTLAVVLSDQSLSKSFASLGALCDCVLVCRASPSQKAAIVTLMKNYEKNKCVEGKMWGLKWTGKLDHMISNKVLSIGDGANDVPMIQRADIGVGIVGKEGRQASNNSDFSIARFRFLVRLLLVHGQTTQYRNANLIKYSFYKNIAISMVMFYYQFYCGFSGQPSIDMLTLNFYNTVFTAVPIIIFSLMDSPVECLETLMKYPQTYNKSRSLHTGIFWKAQVKAFVDAAICFFIPYYSTFYSGSDDLSGLFAVGRISYIALQGVVTLEVFMIARHVTTLFVTFVFYSWVILFPFFYLFDWSMQVLGVPDPGQAGMSNQIFSSAAAWLQMVLVILVSLGLRLGEKGLKAVFYPDDIQLLAEMEVGEKKTQAITRSLLNQSNSPKKMLKKISKTIPSLNNL